LNVAGIFTGQAALPDNVNTPGIPSTDILVVPAPVSKDKLGGVWVADMNGDGIVDNGGRIYFAHDGTVACARKDGSYGTVWNDSITSNAWNTNGPGGGGNNAAAVAAGFVDHWSAPIRIGDAPVQDSGGGNIRGLTGTVLSPTEALLYSTAFDDK